LHLLQEGQNHPIVRFTYLHQTIGKDSWFFSFLYVKLFELGVGVGSYNESAVAHDKVNLLNTHVEAAALSAPMMFLCCSFAPSSFT